jgi:hypothetical protein
MWHAHVLNPQAIRPFALNAEQELMLQPKVPGYNDKSVVNFGGVNFYRQTSNTIYSADYP